MTTAGAAPSPPPRAVRRPMRLALRAAAVLIALAGWWTSQDLLRMTLGGRPTNPLLAAQCGGADPDGDRSDDGCLSVLRSERAYTGSPTGRGVPWAALGAGYFALIGLWHLFVGPATRDRWGWHMLILVVLGCGAWVSISLMNVMAAELRQWCAGCVTTHVLNGALLLVTLAAFPWGRDRSGTVPSPNAALALAALSAGVLAFMAHGLMAVSVNWSRRALMAEQAYQQIVADPDFILWAFSREQPVSLPTGPETEFVGPPDARHTIHVFSDMQCPRCREAHANLRRWLDARPEQVRVAYFHYPLNPSCNAHTKRMMHPAACAAAEAIEAARIVGGMSAAEGMRDALYAGQQELERGGFTALAGEMGLERTAFERALGSGAGRARIEADTALAHSLGVDRVPTIFINGRRFEYWTNAAAWDAVLAGDARPASAPSGPEQER